MIADPQHIDDLGAATGYSFVAPLVASLIAMYREDPRLRKYWANAKSVPEASLNLLRQASKIRDPKNEKPLIYNLAHHDLCDSDEKSKKAKRGGSEASS